MRWASTASTYLFFGRNFARYVEALDALQAHADVVRHSALNVLFQVREVDVGNSFLFAELPEEQIKTHKMSGLE